MSIKLINQALDLDLPPVLKLVMLVLADYADDMGRCWPANPTVARRASVSVRTVQRVIAWLVSHELVEIERRYRKDGSQTSNVYVLFPEATGERGDNLTAPQNGMGGMTAMARTCGVADMPLTNNKQHLLDTHRQVMGDGLEIPQCFSGVHLQKITEVLKAAPERFHQQLLDEVAENYRLQPSKTIPLRLLRFLSDSAKRGAFIPELCLSAQRRLDNVKPVEMPSFSKPTAEQRAERSAMLHKALKCKGSK